MPNAGDRFTSTVVQFNPISIAPGDWGRAVGAATSATAAKTALRWSLQLDPDQGCDIGAPHPQLDVLNFKPTEERRVFCYNPKIDSLAALTSLDLHHAAESNLRNAVFEMPPRMNQ